MREHCVDTVRELPLPVRQKSICGLLLWPAWSFDLIHKYADIVVASDASQDFGFGVSVCKAPCALVISIGRLSERRGEYVRFTSDRDWTHDRHRIGHPYMLNLQQTDFTDVIRRRA